MGNVYEFIIDGVSGLASNGNISTIVAGVSSKGEVGKGYILGKSSDIKGILGRGVLVDRLEDIFATGGQNPIVIAVPLSGTASTTSEVIKAREESPTITLSGNSAIDADVIIKIVLSGNLNAGRFIYSFNAGETYSEEITLPDDNSYILEDSGITINFVDGDHSVADSYSFKLTAPIPTLENIMSGINKVLDTYLVENVYIAGATESTVWSALSALSDQLYNAHKPVFFIVETRMPNSNEDINDWVESVVEDRKKVSARFVQVMAGYGKIVTSTGRVKISNLAGLEVGKTIAVPVQRSVGRVADSAISGLSLLDNYSSAIATVLYDNSLNSAKTYEGISGVFLTDSKTLANATSDYQYTRVVRTVFKALKLMRIAALISINDEIGDPTDPDTQGGIDMLLTKMGNALGTMEKAVPKELAAHQFDVPVGQDYVNNGIAVETTLIGIPIIKSIKLYTKYVYAGSNVDPRVEN